MITVVWFQQIQVLTVKFVMFNEYNYSAGPNVLNTYQNNVATFPQNLMPNISNNNCTVNFNFIQNEKESIGLKII